MLVVLAAEICSTSTLEKAYWVSQVLASLVIALTLVAGLFQLVGVRRAIFSQGFEQNALRIERISDLLLADCVVTSELHFFRPANSLSPPAVLLAEAVLDAFDTILLREQVFERRWARKNVPSLTTWIRDTLFEYPGITYQLRKRAAWYSTKLSLLAPQVSPPRQPSATDNP